MPEIQANPEVNVAALTEQIIGEVSRAVVGKNDVLHQMMCAFLSGGHILLEDYPGLAKTLIANSFASVLGMSFRRIQFTPDLLPGDITGGYVFDRAEGKFVLREGPIFAHVVLADEINRASPRTQSALLEAMQERQVTVEGETMKLPEPFLVIATQNPIEYEGTFPLPEAQLDRFMIKLSVGYPSPDEEKEIIHRRRERKQEDQALQVVGSADDLMAMQRQVEDVFVDEDLEQYLVNLTGKTRNHGQVAVGASPRGTLALLKLSRAWAAIQGRTFVLPDDVKRFVKPALTHRLLLRPDLWSVPQAADRILNEVVQSVPVPVLRNERP
ncbi:MAG TPA: MoxR family ATPase [Phototrophicaceae bacterium]|nr:MoxR family ATPase [Phototrophicaceae bacterium]